MAGSFDNVMKRLIGTYGDQFTQWLDPDATFIQSLNIELKSQHIHADALLQVTKRKKPGILHLEVQTEKDPEMGRRLLEYNVLASRQYDHLPVSSYVIRESRYPMFLRRKNATRGSGVDRKAEMASIGKSRGSLIDPRTEQSQVAIEAAISEGTQFDSHGGGILHDAA